MTDSISPLPSAAPSGAEPARDEYTPDLFDSLPERAPGGRAATRRASARGRHAGAEPSFVTPAVLPAGSDCNEPSLTPAAGEPAEDTRVPAAQVGLPVEAPTEPTEALTEMQSDAWPETRSTAESDARSATTPAAQAAEPHVSMPPIERIPVWQAEINALHGTLTDVRKRLGRLRFIYGLGGVLGLAVLVFQHLEMAELRSDALAAQRRADALGAAVSMQQASLAQLEQRLDELNVATRRAKREAIEARPRPRPRQETIATVPHHRHRAH